MQVSPSPDPFTQQITFAMNVGVAFVFGWFARTPNRFIKVWALKPPYKPRTVLIFRVLFIIWAFSGAYGVINSLLKMDPASRDWLALSKYSALLIAVWWLIVKLVERMHGWHRRDVQPSTRPLRSVE